MRSLWRSFAGGEVTPEFYGRPDHERFQTALKVCRNFVPLPHGPTARRPGTRFVIEVRDSTRPVNLIEFEFSSSQTFMIEMGHFYARFHTNGGTVLEASRAISSIVGNTVAMTLAHLWTTGDDVFIGGQYYRITVTGANTFTTADRWGVARNPIGTTAARVYTIATPYDSADVFSLRFAQDADIITITHPSYAARELRRLSNTNWQIATVSFAPTISAPGAPTVTPTIAQNLNLSPQAYVVTAVAADGTESLQSGTTSANNNLSLAGNFNTISWTAVVGATRYNVYKRRGGSFGYIGQTTGTSIVDDNVTADLTKAPPESNYTLNTGANDFPTAVAYHEQRRWFGGTNSRPQTIWATRNGFDSNLTSSTPLQADDALQFRVRANKQNSIEHLVPFNDLIILTGGGEVRLYADNAPSITFDTLTTKPTGYAGASGVQPVVTPSSIVYVQAQGSRIREFVAGGDGSNAAYRTSDTTLLATHLVNQFTISKLAYSRSPDQIVWAVRNDGVLLSMTYVPEQKVYGWARHDTDGAFESVAVVPEANESAVYVVVRRTINGRQVRYIERFASRLFSALPNAYHLDAGLTYSGAPVSAITNLQHLEGEQVFVFVDGAVEGPYTVVNGSISLEAPSSVVHVGLSFESDFLTMPIAAEVEAFAQGRQKNPKSVFLRVFQSSGVKAGTSFSTLVEYPTRAVDDFMDAPPPMITGEIEVEITPEWTPDGSVAIRQDGPLPLTVLAMTIDAVFAG